MRGGENFGNFETRDFLMGGHIWRARVTFTNIKLHGLDWDFSRHIIDLRRWCSGYFIQRNAGFLFLSRFNFSNCSCVTLSACLKLISFKCQGGNVGIFFYSLKHLLFLFLVKTREEISILSKESKEAIVLRCYNFNTSKYGINNELVIFQIFSLTFQLSRLIAQTTQKSKFIISF